MEKVKVFQKGGGGGGGGIWKYIFQNISKLKTG